MPAQKRPYDTSPTPPPDDEKDDDDSLQTNNNQNHDEEQPDDDSDGTTCSSGVEKDEFITLRLSEVRKEVQCPICLGIIRKTRTVMECLHRFCRECIDKSMRMGSNECPACRTHCASRRSLRDDPNYDALIALLYPDIDKYEEEELAFHEEEKTRNKLIQASIAQTIRRQSEALGRKRTARATAAAFARRSQGSYRNLRGRRNFQGAEHHISDEDEDGNHDVGKDSSSADERSVEVKPKRCKKRVGRPSHASAASDENDAETNQESLGACNGLIRCSEILAWGKGGMRSNTRHGGLGGGTGKFFRNSRVSKLIDHLCPSDENEGQLDVRLMLVSLSEEDIPSLQRPYLCCRPTMEVKHLSQYVAQQTSIEVGEIDIVLIKEINATDNPSSSDIMTISKPIVGDPSKIEIHMVKEHQTLGEIQDTCGFNQRNLILAYRRKSKNRTDHDEGKVTM
ncbi:putative E3 ubiquitin-protein ligase RING1a [Lycium ferocissimum]|uniref:putative E3 ubiquitin-protein ligase RING1a n=1 Tax=Lycium ferocissimum TaxID=112874 RepID=UPI0028158B2B|nr:putative E3 ubiquitin-protein ligase RING1a [Lycium ferocissimum]